MNIKIKKISLQPVNNRRLISLCGPYDDNLKQIEHQLGIIVNRYDHFFKLIGTTISINTAVHVLTTLYAGTESIHGIINDINPEKVYLTIKQIQLSQQKSTPIKNIWSSIIEIRIKNKIIKSRTLNQTQYISNIFTHDIIFGIGPAGTGKTYLATAAAIDLLERQKNQQIILTRPVIEVGEKLGFLPGNINQKTDPYMKPLYDALFDIVGQEQVEEFIQKNVIEIVPLAYMRGRTLHNSIIILDEGQNTTIAQMKMFLTRIGFNSTVIITGDITQIDLPSTQKSGLIHAIQVLSGIQKISFNFFDQEDAVRHTIVTSIIKAYKKWDENNKNCSEFVKHTNKY